MDYRKMYCILLGAIDSALFDLPAEHPVAIKLQTALFEAGELYIDQSEKEKSCED